MKNAVGDVANEFILPAHSKARRLSESFFQTNEDFASQTFGAAGVCVIECDDVGRTFVAQVAFIHAGHRSFSDDRDSDFKIIAGKLVDEEAAYDFSKQFRIQRSRALAIAQ